MSGDPSFSELLQRVSEVCLGAYTHQDLPFNLLVEHLNPQRDTSRAPLFQIGIVLQNVPVQPLNLPGLILTPVEIETQAVQTDLYLNLRDIETALLCSIEYSTELFDASTIIQMLRHYEILLQSIVAQPEARISELTAILAQADEQQRIGKEKAYEETRRQKLKSVKRKMIA
jgi:non-ribosomal peptide synthetase component F